MASTPERSALLKPDDRLTPGRRLTPGTLYFITMDEAPLGHLRQVEAACRAGIHWIQLRMKQAGTALFLETAQAARKICTSQGCALIINDRVEIAAAVAADGIHLGKQDMSVEEARYLLGENTLIGGTANTVEDIREHYRQGADYIGLGPYRYTTTKKNLSPLLGLDGYIRILDHLRREEIDIPLIAIGGIGSDDIRPLLDAGVYGVAFSGLLVHAGNRPATIRLLQDEIQKMKIN